MADLEYSFSISGNKTTISLSNGDRVINMWGYSGAVQCRAVGLGTAETTSYVVSGGSDDIVIPYKQIVFFSGETDPTGDPVADFALLLSSFPTFTAS